MAFSLEKFEHYSYTRNLEMAMRELFSLLSDLDNHYGYVGPEFKVQPLASIDQQEMDRHIWSRTCSAIACLLSDPNLTISNEWQQRIMSSHRWLSALFSASSFHNADHIMRGWNLKSDGSDLSALEINQHNLLKFCWLYSSESEVGLDLDGMFGANPILAVSLCIALLSPRFLGGQTAHQKRELILPWLANHLDRIEDIESLPLGVLHDVYMHCSYADRADKHDVKKAINTLLRKKIHSTGLVGLTQDLGVEIDHAGFEKRSDEKNKPTLLVVLEWFTSAHSIYRTHSLTLEGAREYFNVVGMAYDHCVDEITKQVFDEFIPIKDGGVIDQLKQIQLVANQKQVQICYMPSVGMFPLTMWLSNLRVAPLQVMALGHPATTHSDVIDYVLVEEDYIGDPECFSEKLLVLPKNGMPYRPSEAVKNLEAPVSKDGKGDKLVNIAICATTMKLNPGFLYACKAIAQQSKAQVKFHFLVGQAQGLIYPHVARVVNQVLGDLAKVYPHQDYAAYMKVIAACDLFINPFPFGNTNGIVDCITMGLVGVCKTGREVHEHIDQGLFERLNLPKWLVTKTNDEYVLAAVRLIDDPKLLEKLKMDLSGPDKVKQIFDGEPKIMGQKFYELLEDKGINSKL